MKDITHYFTDLPKKAESAPTSVVKEVRAEPAKIETNTDVVVKNIPSTAKTNTEPSLSEKSKKKRDRVKIKIRLKSGDDAVCDVMDGNPKDLVDKTPSPYDKKTASKRRRKSSVGGSTPIATSNGKSSASSSVASTPIIKKKKSGARSENGKKRSDGQVIPKEFADSFSSVDLLDTKKPGKDNLETSDKKKGKVEQTEKLIELADKKGYSKRKVREEEEAIKIEERLEKRKKLFTESNVNSNTNQNPNNETSVIKRNNLLNYFSKSTPEQLEKERQRNAKVTVKVQVHTPSNSPVPVTPVVDKKTKNSQKKKNKSKQSVDTDEIIMIDSETVIISPPISEKIISPESNKPKWALKIQLQSNHVNSLVQDEEIYTPTLPSKLNKENIKSGEKIPKVLLPMKNKKKELSEPAISNNINTICKDLEKEKQSSKKKEVEIDEDEKSVPERRKSKAEIKKTDIDSNEKTTLLDVNLKDTMSTPDSPDDCKIIEENFTLKTQPKLAPLFTKKCKPSAEVAAARRSFLQSDIQENTSNNKNNNNEIRKPIPPSRCMLPFPKISHINQSSIDSNNSDENCKFSLKINKKFEYYNDSTLMKGVVNLGSKEKVPEFLHECLKSDIETVLSQVKSFYPGAPSLWKNLSEISTVETSKKSQKGKKKSEKKNCKQLNNNQLSELLFSPWTEKYKPKSSTEVIGNEEAAKTLKSWLESWEASKNNEDYSSGDEFYHSDCSTSAKYNNNQVAVLIGPHGSGKTACVYAVAQELGYKVLEVNASSKRPGKKILKEFEEATKSHRVKKSSLKDVFTSASKTTEGKEKIPQNSLILMEDVDLVFEEDEGFVSAVYQLSSNTKRPIVMTLENTCFHLNKIAPQQLRIEFEPVIGKKLAALMHLIAFAESKCKLSQDCIAALCQSGDLRKSLLQLQYIVLPGKESVSSESLAVNNLSWTNMRTQIYKPAIKADKKPKQTNDKKSNNSALISLANSLDNFSLISNLMDIKDPTLSLLNLKSEPSISINENMRCYSHHESTSLEIGNWLNNSINKLSLHKSKKSSNLVGTSASSTLSKNKLITDINFALMQIASNQLDRQALAVDYLGGIRTICRAEEIRRQINSKRGNRFFHYFQGSRLSNVAMKSGNILSAGCKMLQEKLVES